MEYILTSDRAIQFARAIQVDHIDFVAKAKSVISKANDVSSICSALHRNSVFDNEGFRISLTLDCVMILSFFLNINTSYTKLAYVISDLVLSDFP